MISKALSLAALWCLSLMLGAKGAPAGQGSFSLRLSPIAAPQPQLQTAVVQPIAQVSPAVQVQTSQRIVQAQPVVQVNAVQAAAPIVAPAVSVPQGAQSTVEVRGGGIQVAPAPQIAIASAPAPQIIRTVEASPAIATAALSPGVSIPDGAQSTVEVRGGGIQVAPAPLLAPAPLTAISSRLESSNAIIVEDEPVAIQAGAQIAASPVIASGAAAAIASPGVTIPDGAQSTVEVRGTQLSAPAAPAVEQIQIAAPVSPSVTIPDQSQSTVEIRQGVAAAQVLPIAQVQTVQAQLVSPSLAQIRSLTLESPTISLQPVQTVVTSQGQQLILVQK